MAESDGRAVGYLLGAPDDKAHVWGRNVWVDAAGTAVADAEVARDLYAAAAQRWADAGAVAHYVVLPATDAAVVDAWFRLGFGGQQVHAVREGPRPEEHLPRGVRIRRAGRIDVPRLAHLDLLLPNRQRLSPVFSAGPPVAFDEALAEWEESIDDPAYTTFVAEVDGAVVGSAVGCDLTLSSLHVGVSRLPGAGFLGFAAVEPAARGRGIGAALGQAVVRWSDESGRACAVTDWRSTNVEAARTWTRLGFVPTFLRLHRHIGF